MIVEEIKKFVEEECKKPTSNYQGAWDAHIIPVANYSKILAEKLNADVEIVELAALLHDIGSIIYGRENHHITSCEIAEKKLRELGLDPVRIEKIKHCIFAHRGSTNIKKETKEAEIIAEADGMSHFDSLSGLFKSAFIEERLGAEEGNEYVKEKLQRSWNKLSEASKQIIQPKYEAAMLLLN